jgi:hypothetical protein
MKIKIARIAGLLWFCGDLQNGSLKAIPVLTHRTPLYEAERGVLFERYGMKSIQDF